MSVYRLFAYTNGGDRLQGRDFDSDSDADALTIAATLLHSGGGGEVWMEIRFVGFAARSPFNPPRVKVPG